MSKRSKQMQRWVSWAIVTLLILTMVVRFVVPLLRMR